MPEAQNLALAVDDTERDLIDHFKVKALPMGGYLKVKNTGAQPLIHRIYSSHGALNEVKPSTATLDTNQILIDTQVVAAGDNYKFDFGTSDHHEYLKSTAQRQSGSNTTASGWLSKPGQHGA